MNFSLGVYLDGLFKGPAGIKHDRIGQVGSEGQKIVEIGIDGEVQLLLGNPFMGTV